MQPAYIPPAVHHAHARSGAGVIDTPLRATNWGAGQKKPTRISRISIKRSWGRSHRHPARHKPHRRTRSYRGTRSSNKSGTGSNLCRSRTCHSGSASTASRRSEGRSWICQTKNCDKNNRDQQKLFHHYLLLCLVVLFISRPTSLPA